MRRHTHWVLALVTLAMAVGLGVSGCGGGGSDATADNGTTANAGATTGTSGDGSSNEGSTLKFIRVSFFPTSDPTGTIINQGQNQAASDLGADVEYRAPAELNLEPSEMKRLLEGAIASKPDGIMFTDLYPEALNPVVKKATDAGIPVILSYVSPAEAEGSGALTIVGNEDVEAGRLGAEELNQSGAHHVLVLTIPPGIPFVDKRVEGVEEGFKGTVSKEEFDIEQVLNDPAAARNAIETSLQKDPSIDAVFCMGTLLTPAMLAARDRIGGRADEIAWAASDADEPEVKAIQAGELDFTMDSQPYQTGYLSVLLLDQYVSLGITPAAPEFPTGPVVVDKTNVEKVAQFVLPH